MVSYIRSSDLGHVKYGTLRLLSGRREPKYGNSIPSSVNKRLPVEA